MKEIQWNLLRFAVDRENQLILQPENNIGNGEQIKIIPMLDEQELPVEKVNAGQLYWQIPLPNDLKENHQSLCIKYENEQTGEYKEICKLSTAALEKKRDKLFCAVDSISFDGTQCRIRGWMVHKAHGMIKLLLPDGKEVAYQITWEGREDVKKQFPEVADNDTLGFILTCQVQNEKKIMVAFEDGSRKRQVACKLKHGGTQMGSSFGILVYKGLRYLKKNGFKKFIKRIFQGFKRTNVSYKKWYKKHTLSKEQLLAQKKQTFQYQPKFSIIVPLYKTPEKFLDAMISSLLEQTYSNWELCMADGSGDNSLTDVLNAYVQKDSRIKFVTLTENLGISENTNAALELTTGDYIVLGDHDDIFSPNALFECVKVLNKDRSIDVIYSDEDKIDMAGKNHFQPHFKPDFNVDLLRSVNYICHMFVVKKTLLKQVGEFRKEFDGAQDYDFILRCTEAAERIYHIPKILYSWRCHRQSTASNPESKRYAFEAGKKAIEEHYKRVGIQATVEEGEHPGLYNTKYILKEQPLVSIIIPNKDHTEDLDKCISAIEKKSSYKNYEYIIIENNSEKEETFAYYKELENKNKKAHVIFWDKEFNYSAINNFGVQHANGEYLLFLNNDTEIINEDCIQDMLGYCMREDVGIVGARLYFDDGSIQHAGVIVGFGGIAGHAFVTLNEEDGLYFSRSKTAQDYSAVTAACMMTKRQIFNQVGGFTEALQVAFNDIDYCMKVRELGKLVVYNPQAMLYHYESKSRGAEDTPEKVERFNREINYFAEHWPEILEKGDPYYNVNLTLNKADFSLRED